MANKQSSSDGDAPSVEDLARQIEELRGELKGLTDLLSDIAEGGSNAGPAKRSEAAERAARVLNACADGLSQQAEKAVTRQPGIAIGIAAGLGCLVGLLLTRR